MATLPIGTDTRWRVVFKYHFDWLTYNQIVEHLKPISIGTVHNIITRFNDTGDVETHQGENPLGPPNRVLTFDVVDRLVQYMTMNEEAGNGDEMLLEIHAAFIARENLVIDVATLCKALRMYGWTRNRAASSK